MEHQTNSGNIEIRLWQVWIVYVKDSRNPLPEREHKTYYFEEEARDEFARLESETTYRVILRTGTTMCPPPYHPKPRPDGGPHTS